MHAGRQVTARAPNIQLFKLQKETQMVATIVSGLLAVILSHIISLVSGKNVAVNGTSMAGDALMSRQLQGSTAVVYQNIITSYAGTGTQGPAVTVGPPPVLSWIILLEWPWTRRATYTLQMARCVW